MAKQEPKIELVYVGLHPGEEEMPADELENENQEGQTRNDRLWEPDRTEEEPGEQDEPINLKANRVDHFGVEPIVLFQMLRMQARGLPRIEVPRSLTAKQFLDIQEMGAGD